MKVVILAGGRGTRLMEETTRRPKPMVEIGGYPILWHIMQIYAAHNVREFVVALGYRGDVIKRYFLDLPYLQNDFTISLQDGHVDVTRKHGPDLKVSLVDTGLDTMTGGRLARLRPWLSNETFMVTYGDGVGDVDITRLLAFHRQHKRAVTVTAARPPARFGALELDGARVVRFSEKPLAGEGWINGGFFVVEPRALDVIASDVSIWEREPLETLTAAGEVSAYRHDGFWQPMDTLRDKLALEQLWESGQAPWHVWKEPARIAS